MCGDSISVGIDGCPRRSSLAGLGLLNKRPYAVKNADLRESALSILILHSGFGRMCRGVAAGAPRTSATAVSYAGCGWTHGDPSEI